MDSGWIELDADKRERSVYLRLLWEGGRRDENCFRMPPTRLRGKPWTITLWRNAQRVVSERWPPRTVFGEVSPKT
jgi:hypothetical protein